MAFVIKVTFSLYISSELCDMATRQIKTKVRHVSWQTNAHVCTCRSNKK